MSSVMAGRPFKVGRFAHTLRVRLMREHVGVDVDAIEEDQLMARQPVAQDEDEIEVWDPDDEQEEGDVSRGITQVKKRTARDRLMRTVETGVSSGEERCLLRLSADYSNEGRLRERFLQCQQGLWSHGTPCSGSARRRHHCWTSYRSGGREE